MHFAASQRDIEMNTVYGEHSLPWSARLLIYRRVVQGWMVFFLLAALFNALSGGRQGIMFALSLVPLALALVPTLIFRGPVVRGVTLVFLLLLGFFTQSVNPIREIQGAALVGVALVTMARLGWFRERARLKMLVIAPLAVLTAYLSTMEFLITPVTPPRTIWSALNNLTFVANLVYQLCYLTWLPDEYTRRKLRATEMERDIYKHELRHAHANTTVRAPQGTIAQHLDAIDTMASDDLPTERANEYHGRTDAVRHTISYLVRKHFSTLMDKTINRVRR